MIFSRCHWWALGTAVLTAVLAANGWSEASSAGPKISRSVVIGNSGTGDDQRDIPIEIICHKGTGNSAERHVYLGDNVRDDFGDVRFRDSSGSLSYWREELKSGQWARFWVKLPQIPRHGECRLFVEAGQPDATTTSDGKQTFLFFDGFDGECTGQTKETTPPGWNLSLGNGKWTVKDGVLAFRGSGHLTTPARLWRHPTIDRVALRFRARWPDPPFSHPRETAESIGGVIREDTDANREMFLIGLYQELENQRTVASFGGREVGSKVKYDSYVLAPFRDSYRGKFHTFEIERRSEETVARILDTGEELRSNRIIADSLFVMIHGCGFDQLQSPAIEVDWILLRHQPHSEPLYGRWE